MATSATEQRKSHGIANETEDLRMVQHIASGTEE